jgi:uncharacterized membrane protein
MYHEYPLLVIVFLAFGFYAFGRWGFQLSIKEYNLTLITLLIGIVLGHLFWAKWKQGQQEEPQYIPTQRGD